VTDQVPASVATGRKVSMALLVTAVLVTTLLALWALALWVTAPVVV
jgi:hypothetical protein